MKTYLAVTDLEARTLQRREAARTDHAVRQRRAVGRLRWELRWEAREHPDCQAALAHVAQRAGRGLQN